MEGTDQGPGNRKLRRATDSVGRKGAGTALLQMQEGINRLVLRFNELLPEVNGLKREVLVLRGMHEDVNQLKSTVRGMDAAVAAIGKLAERKGIFSQKEVQDEVEALFDDQYGLKDRVYEGEFKKLDVLFLTYSIFDVDGKLISDKPSPTMYLWGSGGVPGFEANAQGCKIGEKVEYVHTLPENYKIKLLQGKTLRTEFIVHQVKTKEKGRGLDVIVDDVNVEDVAKDEKAEGLKLVGSEPEPGGQETGDVSN